MTKNEIKKFNKMIIEAVCKYPKGLIDTNQPHIKFFENGFN